MTGETEQHPSGWTTDTLKAYFDSLRESDLRALSLLNESQKLAQDKFEGTVAARFVQTNEFRQALTDLSQNMATRREVEAAATLSLSRYDAMQKQLGEHQSRLDSGPPGVAALQLGQASQAGRREGVQGLTSNLYAVLAAVAAGAALIGHFVH